MIYFDQDSEQKEEAPNDGAGSKEENAIHYTRTLVQSNAKQRALFEAKQRGGNSGKAVESDKGQKEEAKKSKMSKKMAKYGFSTESAKQSERERKRKSKKSKKALKYRYGYDAKDRLLMERLHGVKREAAEEGHGQRAAVERDRESGGDEPVGGYDLNANPNAVQI